MVASINKTMTIRTTKSHTIPFLCGLLVATVLVALIQPSGAKHLSGDTARTATKAGLRKTGNGHRRLPAENVIAAAAAARAARKKRDVYNKMHKNAWKSTEDRPHKTNQNVSFGQGVLRKTGNGHRRLQAAQCHGPPETCIICHEELPENAARLGCNHKACLPCMEDYITHCCMSCNYTFKCHKLKCNYTMTRAEVQQYITVKDSKKLEKFLESEKKHKATKGQDDCKDDCSMDARSKQWMQENTRPCPDCKKAIERSEGCNSVPCTCGCKFCWLCGMRKGKNQELFSDRCLGCNAMSCNAGENRQAEQARQNADRAAGLDWESLRNARRDNYKLAPELKRIDSYESHSVDTECPICDGRGLDSQNKPCYSCFARDQMTKEQTDDYIEARLAQLNFQLDYNVYDSEKMSSA